MNKFFATFFSISVFMSGAIADTATPSRTLPTVAETNSRTAAVSRTATTKNSSDENKSDSRQTVSRGAASRSVSNESGDGVGRESLEQTVRTVGRSTRTTAASINNTGAVKRAGVTLRPSTAEVGGRATISGTDIQTGSNLDSAKARSVSARAAVSNESPETISQAKDRLTQTAELNSSCQSQYNDCMDQFCSVIDANQKRCTCSASISKYEKVKSNTEELNTQLNDVAQRIRYVGLSESEIEAINTATEAEEVLDKTKDKTESRNMLEKIEDLIKDPSTVSSSYTNASGLDMDLDFSNDSGDLFSIDFLGNNSSSSFSNLRGSDLYSTAKKRCKVVLTNCEKSGADTDQISANYDLLIDKDCINYEQGLTKMNETLVSNVRSAKRMLEKARLAVMEDKNQYDVKGCISALSDCMTDDMVCGANYSKCIDPTKRYIDENGEVVLGENISNITAFMESYNNALIDKEFLRDAYGESISAPNCISDENNDGTCVVKYLLNKIGTGKTVTDGGLCRAVMDRCQEFTYTDGEYQPYNDVVVNYVQRAMVNIQASQRQIISDYASSCMVDIADCYNDQVSQVSSWSSSATVDSVYKVMRGACRNVSLTCSYAVFASDRGSCPQVSTDCTVPGDCDTDSKREDACIESVSTMFYQSLLCPDDSSYTNTTAAIAEDGTYMGYVNDHCTCNAGYVTWDGECVERCVPGEYRTSSGICRDCDANYYSDTPEASGCTACPTLTPYSDSGSDALSDCSATE